MLLHNAPRFSIYFGCADDKIQPDQLHHTLIDTHPIFEKAKKMMSLSSFSFLKQIHSNHGVVVTKNSEHARSFVTEGDFLVTNQPGIGLGVVTADCLPVIVYDKVHNAVGIAHAGWRGSVSGIMPQMIRTMSEQYQSSAKDLEIFFGPCAKKCCYAVSDNFITQLDRHTFAREVIHRHGEGTFFDLPLFNWRLLEGLGVKKKSLHESYIMCTICDHSFYSYRRQKESAGRQITVVGLK